MRVRLWPHTTQPGNLSSFFLTMCTNMRNFDLSYKPMTFGMSKVTEHAFFCHDCWQCLWKSLLLRQEGGLTLPCDVYMGHSLFVPVALCCRIFNMVHSLGLPACRKVFSGCSRLHCGMLHLLNWFLGSHSEPFCPFVLSICSPFLFKIRCHSGVILEIERYVKGDVSNFFSKSLHHRELDRKDCNMHNLTVE